MLSQNRLRYIATKHNLFGTSKKCQGFGSLEKLPILRTNSLVDVNRNSRNLMQQTSLPSRMPVPSLNVSILKFLTAVKPLLNEKEFEETEKAASEFVKVGGTGEKLQKLLIERYNNTENWLSKWWLDKVYLEPRCSLIIACNPATLYPKAAYETLDQQLEFATKYILGFLDFKKYLEEQRLPTEKIGDANLCMDQFYKLLVSCRLPNKNKDDFKVVDTDNVDISSTNHIIVMYKNRLFRLQIIDPATGLSSNSSEILNNLRSIINATVQKGIGLGAMTAADRDTWYEVYTELSKNKNNEANFKSIHESYFVLCLDDESSDETDNCQETFEVRSAACGQLLHGNKKFTSNRWFDKTVQVIIGPKGIWGTNYEHSMGEAPPHIQMNDYIYRHVLQNHEKYTESPEFITQNLNKIKELNFEIPPAVQDTIRSTVLLTSRLIDNLDLFVLDFDAFGKNFPKSQKISPDAFTQVAMQLAFYRTHRILGNAYESGSLRKFHLGRTDIIRSCNLAAAKFVRAMLSEASHPEKSKLFLDAIAAHRQLTTDVMNMESFDRHFFGLRNIANENAIKLPDIYLGTGFRKMNHFYISSSQISSKFGIATTYGPLVDDGYGSAYNIMENRIIFGLSALKNCPQTNVKVFGNNLKQSLLDCQSLLVKVKHKL